MGAIATGEGFGRERLNTDRTNHRARWWRRLAVHQDERSQQNPRSAVSRNDQCERQADRGVEVRERAPLAEERATEQAERRPDGAPDPPGAGRSRIAGFIDKLRVAPVHAMISHLRDHEVAANTAADEIARRNDTGRVNDIYDAIFPPVRREED